MRSKKEAAETTDVLFKAPQDMSVFQNKKYRHRNEVLVDWDRLWPNSKVRPPENFIVIDQEGNRRVRFLSYQMLYDHLGAPRTSYIRFLHIMQETGNIRQAAGFEAYRNPKNDVTVNRTRVEKSACAKKYNLTAAQMDKFAKKYPNCDMALVLSVLS